MLSEKNRGETSKLTCYYSLRSSCSKGLLYAATASGLSLASLHFSELNTHGNNNPVKSDPGMRELLFLICSDLKSYRLCKDIFDGLSYDSS